MPFTESEIRISRANLAIAALSVLAVGLVIYDLTLPRDDIGFLAMPLFCSAVLIRIRTMFCALHRQWSAAFDMGVTVGREQAKEEGRVRSLR